MDGVVDSDPDIEQPQAGDDSTHDTVQGQRSQMRYQCQQSILIPEVHPGQYHNDEAEIEAYDDAHEEIESLQPAGRLTRWLCAFRRTHGKPRRRSDGRLSGKEILLRHAMV